MNKISTTILKAFRKFHQLLNPDAHSPMRNWKMFSNKHYANNLISEYILGDKPFMAARFGSTEMMCLANYIGVKRQDKSWINFIKGKSLPWWWEMNSIERLQEQSGFFPVSIPKIEQFCELMLQDISSIDILGSWLTQEKLFTPALSNTKSVMLEDLEPFFTDNPWTRSLENKKVLIVHPFAETIEQQYLKRSKLFDNNLLPQFTLTTIKAIQTAVGEKSQFADWFEALEYMKMEMNSIDYEVAIIGCGAYGLPLAAHAKRMGKKAIHLGGVTQLLFGIKGKRWEDYIVWPYMNLFNEFWVRPGENEKPKNANVLEEACYW